MLAEELDVPPVLLEPVLEPLDAAACVALARPPEVAFADPLLELELADALPVEVALVAVVPLELPLGPPVAPGPFTSSHTPSWQN